MAEPFTGQISVFGFNFPPVNWATCQGQILPISQYTQLFSLLGTRFGGNGTSNFGLPNLQGNVAVGMGTPPGGDTYDLGETGGEPNAALSSQQSGAHSHALMATTANASVNTAAGNVLAKPLGPGQQQHAAGNIYNRNTPGTAVTVGVSSVGGSAPHNNMQPFLALTYCICLNGIFPTRP